MYKQCSLLTFLPVDIGYVGTDQIELAHHFIPTHRSGAIVILMCSGKNRIPNTHTHTHTRMSAPLKSVTNSTEQWLNVIRGMQFFSRYDHNVHIYGALQNLCITINR